MDALVACLLLLAAIRGRRRPRERRLRPPRSRGQVRLRRHRRLRLPHRAEGAVNAGGRSYDGPFGTVYSSEHHAGPRDRDRRLDGRADHHRDAPRPPAERRAADPGAPVHRVQRHGRGGPPGPGGLPADGPAGQPRDPAEEDLHAALRVRVPSGLARGLRAEETPPASARPAAWRAANTSFARSATAASATPRGP